MNLEMYKTTEIQAYLSEAQRSYHPKPQSNHWNDVAETLWLQILHGFGNLDDQLLACTCLFTIVPLSNNQLEHLSKIETLFHVEKKNPPYFEQYCTISLMYGMFQSAFLTNHKFEGKIKTAVEVLVKKSFDILTAMGYEYSKYTFITFKTISSFKKIIGTDFEHIIFSDNNSKLLNLVNHNWENPITGVRDLNRIIFKTLISTFSDASYKNVIKEINTFNWNKAKYLMLSEVIDGKPYHTVLQDEWIDGIIHSLHKPGLVSAGADMYYAVLKTIRFDTDWSTIFLEKVIAVLTGVSYKAIENFSNYWCLTTLKRFPTLLDILLQELEQKSKCTEQILYSMFCLKKQGNKLGFLQKPFDDDKFLTTLKSGLGHCNVYIRSLAFDIICVSKFITYPSKAEYKLITNFIADNINSDSSVLRQNMLNSLKFFLHRTHSAFLNQCKDNASAVNDDLIDFCKDLQNVLIISLSIQGNYQRKITSIKLVNLIFQEFSMLCSKKKREATFNQSLLQFYKSEGIWMMSDKEFVLKLTTYLKDPSDDVRENVMQILLQYHFEYLSQTDFFIALIDDGLNYLRSKFFYEINCGHSLFKLILNILLKKEQLHSKFRTIEDVFEFAATEIISEFNSKRDILQSIEEGKQLHSFISILSLVIDLSIKNKYQLKNINKTKMRELLIILEAVSVQFASKDEGFSNSDFSRISDIVEGTIIQSGLNSHESNEETKITGLHQIVLNCMWLNVKECCVLSALLIRYHSNDDHKDVCLSCLNIITNVLETSRHKGAIEAAGTALGNSIQYLTSLDEDSKLSQIPLSLLQHKLDLLISDASRMASITRRGAGLSILVHRIVSSDTRKGKPLFHYFMRTLLTSCKLEDTGPTLAQEQDIDNQKDLPQAIYIHFLTKIIIDSRLASDIMYYSASLAELAFSNLTSPFWQIRNAALQLYGALIPKLIGQNKQAGIEEGTIATVAFDEFRTHSLSLWNYIKHQLSISNTSENIIAHSDLVPILNLLASCAARYNFNSDTSGSNRLEELFEGFMHLLGSSIFVVRKLTTKCICNIFSFARVYEELIKINGVITENKLHGCLLLTQMYSKLYAHRAEQGLYINEFTKLQERFSQIMNTKKHSFMCKSLYEEIWQRGSIESIKKAFCELQKCNEPNIHNWANHRLFRCVRDCALADIPQILTIVINANQSEELLLPIHQKLVVSNVPPNILDSIVDILIDRVEQANSFHMWKILYEISLKQSINTDIAKKCLESNNFYVSYKFRYILPLAAKTSNVCDEYLNKISELISHLSDPDNADCDMRYIAALANNHLAERAFKLSDKAKINTIKSAVMLLQDEDEDVRNASVLFYKNTTSQFTLHPFICLNKILKKYYLQQIFKLSDISIKVLCCEVNALLQSFSKSNTDEFNPFSNDTKNIYLEVDYIQQLVDILQCS